MFGKEKAPQGLAATEGRGMGEGGLLEDSLVSPNTAVKPPTNDQKIKVTYWLNVSGTRKKEVELSLLEFFEVLKKVKPKPDKKKCPLIKLGTFGDARTEKNSLRFDANVTKIYGVELDLDNGVLTFDQVKALLEQANIRAIIVTTHSHTSDHPRLRVFCPLSTPCDPYERKLFVARLNGVLEGNLASESFTLSQSYFIGGKPGGEYRVECTFDDPEDGYCIDELPQLDEFADYGKTKDDNTSKANMETWTVPEGELEQRLAAARRDKKLLALERGEVETGESKNYHSRSEADFALCGKWAFYLGADPVAIEREVRKSNLRHEKWDRPDYLRRTIMSVLEKQTETYQLPAITNQETSEAIKLAYKEQRGCAELFARMYRGRLCFDHTDGAWFKFSKHYWTLEKIGDRLHYAVDQVQSVFQKMERELDGEIVLLGQKIKNTEDENEAKKLKQQLTTIKKQQKTLNKLIGNLNTLGYRKQVVEFAAQGEGSLGISGDEWDLQPWVLPCPNGIVDLRTGNLREGKPEDYLRAACPTTFRPEATAPRYEQALQEIFAEDQDLIRFVQRVLGMALVGETVEHKLIVLWGAGRNGKDTLLEALSHVLGAVLAGAVQSELLLDQGRTKSSSGPSADIMRLRGLRVAWASETNEGRRLDAGKIKLLTGGGSLVGRSPYARYEVSFPQSHTLFLLTNSKPHAPADDYALWKRLVLIPFTQSFVDQPSKPHERQADKGLVDKLKSEAEGILAWLVEGCLEWQHTGLNSPAVVQQATQDYRKEEDILLQFTEDGCIQGPDCMAPAQKLYDHYRVTV